MNQTERLFSLANAMKKFLLLLLAAAAPAFGESTAWQTLNQSAEAPQGATLEETSQNGGASFSGSRPTLVAALNPEGRSQKASTALSASSSRTGSVPPSPGGQDQQLQKGALVVGGVAALVGMNFLSFAALGWASGLLIPGAALLAAGGLVAFLAYQSLKA